ILAKGIKLWLNLDPGKQTRAFVKCLSQQPDRLILVFEGYMYVRKNPRINPFPIGRPRLQVADNLLRFSPVAGLRMDVADFRNDPWPLLRLVGRPIQCFKSFLILLLLPVELREAPVSIRK